MTEAAVLAALVVVYAITARRLDRWSVTAAIAFTVSGALLGPSGLDVLPVVVDAESTKLLAELALAVLLFGDATTVDPRGARHDAMLTGRLLFVGLPLTIAVGTAVGLVLFAHGSMVEAALLAAMLAPTDAALGMAVFTNRAVPARVRRVLNVESGLNDGIATPVVTLLIALAVSDAVAGGGNWVVDAVQEMAIGAGLGIGIGVAAGLVFVVAARRGWASSVSLEIGVLGLAVLAFTSAVATEGNGFIAAFVAGLAFRTASRGKLRERVEYTETTGQVLSAVVWVLFGALLAAPAVLEGFEARPILYAVAALTIARMLPVAIALAGSGLRPQTVAFMGWFGPRGLASVVFTLLLIVESEAAGAGHPHELVLAASWTILLSVLAHGLTAGGLGRRYGAVIERMGPGLPETEGPEPRHRRLALAHDPAEPAGGTPGTGPRG